jgi:hypothetical protein
MLHYSPSLKITMLLIFLNTQSNHACGFYSLYGLLLAPVSVGSNLVAGGGPGGGLYSGAASPDSAGRRVGSPLHCVGSTFVAPAGG